MRYKTVIFDLDGTLTDSAAGILDAAASALDRMGFPRPAEATLRRFLGPPLAESYMAYCGMTAEEAARATSLYREKYVHQEGWKINAVYPGIRRLLTRLKGMGCSLAVATGKPEVVALPILKYFDLRDFFDIVACPALNDLHADKAALISRVMEKLPGPALMVGDIPGDITGAKRAGVDSCAAMWGYGNDEEILAEEPTLAPDAPEDLIRELTGEDEPKGYFITFEGVDGCGKSTQLRALKDRLEAFGYRVTLTREPGGCPLSEEIRKILLAKEDNGMCAETEALLFAASRAQHIHDTILPARRAGRVVLCDRFVDSSVVYQGAGRGLGTDFIRAINREAYSTGLPDMTIYLRMDAVSALARREKAAVMDRIERSGSDFFETNARAFDALAANDPRFVTVDGARDRDVIGREIFDLVYARLKEASVL